MEILEIIILGCCKHINDTGSEKIGEAALRKKIREGVARGSI